MQLNDYVNVVFRRWPWLVVTVALGAGLGILATFAMPRQYEASIGLFVSTSVTVEQDAGQLLQSSTFAQQRVKSYAEAITSPIVLQPVIDDLGLDATPHDLAQQVSSEVPLDTVMINITVTDEDPEQAALLTNAIAESFSLVVPELEGATTQTTPVSVTTLSTATAPTAPISPQPALNLLVGTGLGLLAGFAIILARELSAPRVGAKHADVTPTR